MTAALVFSIVNTLALLVWIFLITGARWLPRAFAAVRYAFPVALAGVYAVCLFLGKPEEGAGFGSLEAVTKLFTHEWTILGGWIHYLVFDFFVGCWILEKAKTEAIPHWQIVVPMIFTFMLGPVGLALFLVLWGARRKLVKSG